MKTDSGLQDVLSKLGLNDRVVEGNDREMLGSLDVIACGQNVILPEEELRAILAAVRGGVGFMNLATFCHQDPGYTEEVQELLGIQDGFYTWKGDVDQNCTVLQSHPILGVLEPGDGFWIRMASGYVGVVDGIPLLGPPEGFDPSFCPLYVRQLGEGRVVNIQWYSDPKPTHPYTVDEFYTRCINWAAKRPVGAKWIAGGDQAGM